MLVHVVDIADAQMEGQIESVRRILLETDLDQKPVILVFNKIDLLESEIAHNLCRLYGAFGVSALERRHFGRPRRT